MLIKLRTWGAGASEVVKLGRMERRMRQMRVQQRESRMRRAWVQKRIRGSRMEASERTRVRMVSWEGFCGWVEGVTSVRC